MGFTTDAGILARWRSGSAEARARKQNGFGGLPSSVVPGGDVLSSGNGTCRGKGPAARESMAAAEVSGEALYAGVDGRAQPLRCWRAAVVMLGEALDDGQRIRLGPGVAVALETPAAARGAGGFRRGRCISSNRSRAAPRLRDPGVGSGGRFSSARPEAVGEAGVQWWCARVDGVEEWDEEVERRGDGAGSGVAEWNEEVERRGDRAASGVAEWNEEVERRGDGARSGVER